MFARFHISAQLSQMHMISCSQALHVGQVVVEVQKTLPHDFSENLEEGIWSNGGGEQGWLLSNHTLVTYRNVLIFAAYFCKYKKPFWNWVPEPH